MSGREQILGAIRRSLGRGPLDPSQQADLDSRLDSRPRGIVPARVDRPQPELVDLFETMAREAAAVVRRVPDFASVPDAVQGFLAEHNLPAELVASPALAELPWAGRPTLSVRFDAARDADLVSVTPAFAGIAETGTLMLPSGAGTPSTLNFLPDTHIVVLPSARIVGPYEDAWDRLRARDRVGEGGLLPRTVNLVTGPSRSGDIEQIIQLGAHGPRRLLILVVEQGDWPGS
ncbi:MAG: lactate utilization protein C [Alphaproteobacteria bacterium]|nr:lactate utilization protein [Alphaproteobacteria bacterium]TAD87824.1 MAG: lactate utilization protein C [Alphaproteobacteria bacterium]